MNTKTLILGSGIGGLAAGAALKNAGETDFMILDSCKSLPLNLNNGVHYLHSNNFGIPFPFELKKISSVEEIWHPRTDTFKKVSCLPEMIDYSMKVMGTRHPSSIQDPGTRNWDTWIPESNDMNDLLRAYYDFIGPEHFIWDKTVSGVFEQAHTVVAGSESYDYINLITTVPLDKFNAMSEFKIQKVSFKNQPVFITNYKTENIVSNWLISLYISDNQFPPYRITIMNNNISMESVRELTVTDEHIIRYHLGRYFEYELDGVSKYEWKTGRIFGLPKKDRENIVSEYKKDDIYLLGRYGTWNGKEIMDTTAMAANKIVDEIIKLDKQLV